MTSIFGSATKRMFANVATGLSTFSRARMGATSGNASTIRSLGAFTRSITKQYNGNCRSAQFSTASGIQYAKKGRPGPGEGFEVNFVMQDGEEVSVRAHEGESLLDVAWANDIDIEGACEASLACSTCHLILDEDSFQKLEEPSDEENDMLDLAFGLTDTSRLGCQVLMNKELDGIVAKIPAMTRNA
ncbi:hypothetical protein BGZ49_001742, partial [Haplosporangium sp. Z 27]